MLARRQCSLGLVIGWTVFLFLLWEVRSFARGVERGEELRNGPSPTSTEPPVKPGPPPPPDRVVVMGRLSTEDGSWLKENFKNWQHAIYLLDTSTPTSTRWNGTAHTNGTTNGTTYANASSPLHLASKPLYADPKRGREAYAYLEYIVRNYDMLPSTMVFLPPRVAGEADDEDYNALGVMRNMKIDWILRNVNTDYIQRVGYANLICSRSPGCPSDLQPFRDPPDTQRPFENAMQTAWVELFNKTAVPKVVATPCCSQFGVSAWMVRSRPLEEYQRYLDWLKKEKVKDSEKIFENLWHILFGQSVVHCPSMGTCYCYVYGKCLG